MSPTSVVRIGVATAFAAAAVTGGAVLLLHPPAPSHHGMHHAAPASTTATKSSEDVLPKLGFDPSALTRDLTAAVQRTAGTVRVSDAQLLFHDEDGDRRTAGLFACVTDAEHSDPQPTQITLDDVGGTWRVVREAASGVPC